jgi:cell division protein FtsB
VNELSFGDKMGCDDRAFWQMIHAKKENKELVEVIRQLRAENEELKTENEQLKKRIPELESKP